MHLHKWDAWSDVIDYGQVTLAGYPILYQLRTCKKCNKTKSRKTY